MSAEKSKFWHLIKNNLEEIYIDIDSDKNIVYETLISEGICAN
jgi:hypothetical protein